MKIRTRVHSQKVRTSRAFRRQGFHRSGGHVGSSKPFRIKTYWRKPK